MKEISLLELSSILVIKVQYNVMSFSPLSWSFEYYVGAHWASPAFRAYNDLFWDVDGASSGDGAKQIAVTMNEPYSNSLLLNKVISCRLSNNFHKFSNTLNVAKH